MFSLESLQVVILQHIELAGSLSEVIGKVNSSQATWLASGFVHVLAKLCYKWKNKKKKEKKKKGGRGRNKRNTNLSESESH